MAVLALPTSLTLTHYEMRLSLDGVAYALVFHWNDRDESWYLDILTDEDERIASGLKIIVGWPLGIRSADLRMPAGLLMAIDTSGEGRQPAIDELGERVILYYYEAETLFGDE
jgi:hypothetical protein